MTSIETRSKFTVLFAAVLLFFCGQFARAAENNSTVEGVVQDASGKPVAGAFVKLKNNDRHLEFMVISQAQGRYTVSNLPAGKYVIQGVGGGYQSNVSAPVDVAEGKTAKQDLSLTAKQAPMLPRAWPMKTPEALMVTVSKDLPDGDGKKLVAARCTTCHNTERFVGFHMPREDWAFTIRRMRARMRTAKIRDLTPDEAKLAIDYLTANFSPLRQVDLNDRLPRTLLEGKALHYRAVQYDIVDTMLGSEPHDVAVDPHGNGWVSQRAGKLGKLDPKTGIVTEYKIPLTPGSMPGTHHAVIDKNGIAWISENWAHQLNRLDPKTGEVKQLLIESKTPINAPSFGNFTLDQDGYVWDARADRVVRMDPNTGKVLQQWPLQANSSYDNAISYDGKYWGGSGPANWGNTVEMLDIESGKMLNLNSGTHMMTAKRGGFDPYGNTWWGGADGSLIELNAKAARIDEYTPPIAPHPYTDFYEAMPDKNGEVWAGVLHGRQMLRFNPKTSHWSAYQMPEPYSYDRRTYIDASTHPVTVWYVDYNGYLVRVQPLD